MRRRLAAPVLPRGLSLRTHLLLMVVIVLLPVLIFTGLLIRERFRSYSDQEIASSTELAQAIASNFLGYLEAIWTMEDALGTAIFLSSGHLSTDQMQNLIERQVAEHPTVRALSWVDPEGTVVVSAPIGAEGISLADRAYVKRIQEGRTRELSDVLVGRMSHGLSASVARGVWWNGELVGIVIAEIDLRRLDSIFRSERRGARLFGVADASGRVAYRSVGNDISFEERLMTNPGPALTALERRATVSDYRFTSSIDGVRRMGTGVYLPSIGWVAFAVSPTTEVYAAAWRLATRDVAILAAIVLVGMTAGLWWSNRLVRPLRDLQRAAADVAQGRLDIALKTAGPFEICATTESFRKMVDQLSALEAMRRRLIQATTHEVKNPLASVKAVFQLLRFRMTAMPAENDLEDVIRRGEREIDRANRLLGQLGDAMRIQDRTFHIERKPVDLARVVNNAVEPFRAMVEAKQDHHVLNVDVPSHPVMVIGDELRLEQVATNLLSNAVKYSPAGTKVTVAVRLDGSDALLTVSDDGPGIPPDEIDKVFESYYRGQNVSGSEGMGLGLYICNEIVQRLGGVISVESREGAGTTFRVRLPRADEEES